MSRAAYASAAKAMLDLPRPSVEFVMIDLPRPPSVNNLFANSARGGRHKTEKYSDWMAKAGWYLQVQRPGSVIGPYCALIEVERPKRRGRVDLANYEKAISDLLVAHRLIEDDSMAQEIILRWADVEGVRVTVRKFEVVT